MIFIILGGCGPKISDDGQYVPPDREVISIQINDGGNGIEWIKKAAEDFNALPENSDYFVIIKPVAEDKIADIKISIESGVSANDAYFTSEPNIKSIISADLLVDMKDFAQTTKVPGEDVTIMEKLRDPEDVLTTFSNYGEGLYGIPYANGFAGFVFDYQLFEEKGWLFYDMENGQEILSKGPDGVAGTYDDGQPRNMTEWQQLIDNIASKANTYPFIFNTKYPNYLTNMVDAILAQYSGIDGYKTFINYEGSFTDSDGNTVNVTPETGYKVYDLPGLEKGVSFLDTYLTNNQSYVFPRSWKTTETSHRDAQNSFLIGYRQSTQAPLAAMLFEGTWWENEAKPMFDSLVKNGQPERGYGKRDYRFMMFPAMEGQKGIDGTGHGSVFNCMEAGAAFVVKNEKDAEKQQKVLDFIAYTCKDEYLQLFTIISGSIRPYNYTLSEEQLSKMTPFQNNVWQIYNDTENVRLIRTNFDSNASPFYYDSSKSVRYYTYIEAGYPTIFKAAERHNAQELLQSMRSYNATNWSKYYSEVADKL